jgi:hypothetical protein
MRNIKIKDMRKLYFVVAMLVMRVVMLAGGNKPLRVVVLGDDPMMVSDESAGSVGYATLLQPLFDELVTVEVLASATLLPNDPAALLEPAKKGDVAMICKRPVEAEEEDKTMADVYLDQLLAISHAAKKKGVKIVWMTPACVRYFTADSVQVHRQGVYPEVVRRLCRRDFVSLVDVEQLMFDWLKETGVEASAEAFMPVQPQSAVFAEKAAREGNLLTETGAQKVAALIGEAIFKDKKNILSKRIRQ